MSVGFLVFADWHEFGYSETLYSWFSTVCYKLEGNEWGSKYPITMNKLYYDEENGVPYELIEPFRKEIQKIENEFLKLKPSDAIWSCEERIYNIPQSKPNINYQALTLKEFYVSNGSPDIFNQIRKCIEDSTYYYKKYGNDYDISICIRDENNI